MKFVLPVNERIAITGINKGDLHHLSKHINDPEIYDNTLKVPHPYTLSDAKAFYRHVEEFRRTHGFAKDFAIRLDGVMSGGIGLMFNYGLASHKSELGYWLARGFWNQGIMSLAIPAFTDHVFGTTSIVRIEAHVFDSNPASSRVLEKSGFVREGVMKKAFLKDGKYKDAILYALIA